MSNVLKMLSRGGGAAAAETDPNFNQTVLLLHGDGTNGAQNNTFLDGSTNNFTITRNGNTTQGTFSPFSVGAGEWSVASDGSGDNLSIAYNSALDITQGDYTVEFWIYRTVGGVQLEVINQRGSTIGWLVRINSNNTIVFGYAGGGATVTSVGTIPINEWVHVAGTREGNTPRVFINGVLDNTGSGGNGTTSTATFYINRSYTSSGGGVTGYLSNLRIVKGTALYTADFTVPTAPLTAVSGTSLLTLQDNRFVDNSTNNFAITNVGTIATSSFSPFAPTAAYSAGTNGGSGYFDGTGDYLTVANNSAFDFAGGDFTIEGWFYRQAAVTQRIIAKRATGTSFGPFLIAIASVGQVSFFASFNGTNTGLTLNSSVYANLLEWNHFAVTRSGSSWTLWLNGASSATTTNASSVVANTDAVSIGVGSADFTSGIYTGYLADIRFVKGTAIYTSAFTPPTAPVTNISNTSLLLNFTNAGIFDNTGKNNLETVGNAQIDTTTKKFGTGSMEFDGTGDWLVIANTQDTQLRTGIFTIEFWVYLASGDTGSNRGLVAKGAASTGWLVSLNTTEKVVFTFTTSTITSTGSINLNSWNHIAVVREGTGSNQTKIYINGANDGTGTVSTDFNQTSVMYVGANRTGGDPMKGFIDDLRVTKGVARYTANFTPPAQAFPDN